MKSSNPIAHLLIVEIERKGFLIEVCSDIEKAKQRLEELVELSVKYSFNEQHRAEQDLTYFASYEIYGTEVYVGKSSHSISNGSYTVSIVEIDLDTFCVKTFIRERENHSCVLHRYTQEDVDRELYSRYEKLSELFPHLNTIAN